MRVFARVAGVAALMLVVAALALAVALPRIAAAPSVRAYLAGAATSALGYRFAFEELDLQLLPPTLVFGRAELGGKASAAPELARGREADPITRAERIELTLAVTPLLAGIVLIDSAVVVGARLQVVRTRRGFQFGAPARPDSSSVDIVLRGVELRDAAVVLEDRTVAPSLRWEVRDVWARVFAEGLNSPVRVELNGELASGGQLTAQGEVTLAGAVDLDLKFDSLAIAAAKPYFESRSRVEGFLTGSIRATGTVASPTVELEADFQEARLRLGEIALFGLLKISARIDDAWEAPHGRIELDATQAKLIYADFLTKPAGTAASVTGNLTRNPDGSFAIDGWKFVMKDVDTRS